MHALYCLAEIDGYSQVPFVLHTAQPSFKPSVQSLYLRTLILDVLNTGQLSKIQIEIADGWFSSWCNDYALESEYSSRHHLFYVDLASDYGPAPHETRQPRRHHALPARRRAQGTDRGGPGGIAPRAPLRGLWRGRGVPRRGARGAPRDHREALPVDPRRQREPHRGAHALRGPRGRRGDRNRERDAEDPRGARRAARSACRPRRSRHPTLSSSRPAACRSWRADGQQAPRRVRPIPTSSAGGCTT